MGIPMEVHPYIGLARYLFAIALVLLFPLIDLPSMRRLKRFSSAAARLAIYRQSVVSTWICTCVAVILAPLGALLIVPRRIGDLPWLDGKPVIGTLLGALIALLFAWILWPSIKCTLDNSTRKKYLKAYQASFIRYMLPVSRDERTWWVLLSVTAGVCEELLYRGFLLQFLHGHLAGGPAMSLTLAWLLSSLAFGVAHIYQGVRGVVETTIAGLVFGLVAILSGNLALPILLHCLIDLRILLLYHPAQDAPESAAALVSGFDPSVR